MLSILGLLTIAGLIYGWYYYRKHRTAADAIIAEVKAVTTPAAAPVAAPTDKPAA
jgi:uncharacterized membrane protein YpjA